MDNSKQQTDKIVKFIQDKFLNTTPASAKALKDLWSNTYLYMEQDNFTTDNACYRASIYEFIDVLYAGCTEKSIIEFFENQESPMYFAQAIADMQRWIFTYLTGNGEYSCRFKNYAEVRDVLHRLIDIQQFVTSVVYNPNIKTIN